MIDCQQLSVVSASDADYEFSYQVKKLAQGPHITERWGWDEDKQRRFHRKAWEEERPDVITYQEEQIGTITVLKENNCVRVAQFFILPEYQRQGIGSFLLEGILKNADTAGKLSKVTFLEGSPVESLYRRYGFNLVEQGDGFCFMERPSSESKRRQE